MVVKSGRQTRKGLYITNTTHLHIGRKPTIVQGAAQRRTYCSMPLTFLSGIVVSTAVAKATGSYSVFLRVRQLPAT